MRFRIALTLMFSCFIVPAAFANSDGKFPGKGNYTAWVNANNFLKFGNEFASKGQIDKALDNYKKAINTYEFDSIYYFNLGNAFAMKQQYSIAEESFRKAIDLESNYFQAYLNLGHVIARQGRPAEAAKVLKKAASLSRNPVEKAEIEKSIAQFEQLPEMESPQSPHKKSKKKSKKSHHDE